MIARRTTLVGFILATLCAVGLGVSHAADDRETIEVSVGQTPITIPVPAGFAVQSDLMAFQRWVEVNLDPNARALVGLLRVATAGETGTSAPPLALRELSVSTLADIEHGSFSSREFDEVRASVRQAVANAQSAAATVVPEEVIVNGDEKPAATPAHRRPLAPPEIVFDDARAIVVAPSGSLDISALTPDARLLRATAYLRVRDKVLVLTALAEIDEQEALDWLRDFPRRWSQEILAAQPPVGPSAETASSSEGQGPSLAPPGVAHEPIWAEPEPEADWIVIGALGAAVAVIVGAITYFAIRRRSAAGKAGQPPPVRAAVRRGKLLAIVGATLLVVVLITNFAGRFLPVDPGVGIALTVAMNLALITGAFLYYRGRQYRAKAASLQPPDLQAHAPVLYLRSFKADPTAPRQAFGALLLPNLLRGLATVEEQLAVVLAPVGPLVAIGEPDESLPTPGGVRLYESNDAWQRAVIELMQRARLVIVRAGDTPGLWWEIERCRELLDPPRFLIFFYRLRKTQYQTFRDKAKATLGVELPADTRLQRKGGFVAFDRDWQPRVLVLRAPFTRTRMYWPLRPLFNHALQPVFEALRVAWQPSPVAGGRMAFLSLVAAFLVFLVVFVVAALLQ